MPVPERAAQFTIAPFGETGKPPGAGTHRPGGCGSTVAEAWWPAATVFLALQDAGSCGATLSFQESPMLRSMTAFASAEADTGHGTLAIELRSVNHRYLELGLRLPDELPLEPAIRERVAARLARGKRRSRLRWKSAVAEASAITVDEERQSGLAETVNSPVGEVPGASASTSLRRCRFRRAGRSRHGSRRLARFCAERARRGVDDMVATRAREGERLGAFS